MKKLSQGFGEVCLKTTVGPDVVFAYQIVGDRMYLDLAKRGALFFLGASEIGKLEEGLKGTPDTIVSSEKVYMDAVGSELGKLVKDMKRHEGLRVILVGRLPAVWQLRPDLEQFYVGLPDDYRVEGVFGISARKEPVRIKLGKVDFDMVSLAETWIRKMTSIMMGCWRDESGSLKSGPAEGRETDLSDHYLICLTLGDVEEVDKSAAGWSSYWKTKLPDLYARMRVAGLLVGVE